MVSLFRSPVFVSFVSLFSNNCNFYLEVFCVYNFTTVLQSLARPQGIVYKLFHLPVPLFFELNYKVEACNAKFSDTLRQLCRFVLSVVSQLCSC